MTSDASRHDAVAHGISDTDHSKRKSSDGTLRAGWLARLGAVALPLAAGLLLAATPVLAAAGWVYTADEKGSTISVVDLARKESTAIRVPVSPHNVQISEDGRTLLAVGAAAGHGGGHGKAEPGRLLVYDARDVARGPSADIAIGPHPAHVVLDGAGRVAYATDSVENVVYAVDLADRRVTRRIATGRYPHGLRLSPDGRELYVANVRDGSLSIIDVASGSEAARVSVGKSPVQVGFTPDGTRAYVSLNGENAVAVVDTATRRVVGRIPVGRNPVQVFATPDGRFVYAANQGTEADPEDTVTAIDVAAGKPVATLTTGKGAHGVVASKRGDRVFVSNIVANSISVIDVPAQKVVATIAVGKGPNGITFRE